MQVTVELPSVGIQGAQAGREQQLQQGAKLGPMDSKVLLSVAAAIQGNGLAQALQELAAKKQAGKDSSA